MAADFEGRGQQLVVGGEGLVREDELAQTGRERTRLARDAYTLWHFPLVSGIIALAVGFEASFHPDDYALIQITVAVGVGLTLFLTSTAGALRRAKGCVLWNRLIVLTIILGALAAGATSSINQILGTACVGLALIVGIEQVTVRRRMGRA